MMQGGLMERNIIEYEVDYSNVAYGFEKYKIIYRRRKILEIMEEYQPKTVLEIGCGPEPLFCYVKDRKFTIVEPSDRFYKNAKKLSIQNSKVTCIKGFFEEVAHDLQKEGISYEMVVCSSLLHEVVEPEKLLEAIKMVCSQSTIIHLSVPNMHSVHRLLGVEMGILSDVYSKSEGNEILQQNTNFDLQKLKSMVEGHGMKIEGEGSYFIKPFSHGQMEKMVEQRIIDESVLEGLYKLTEYMPQYGSEIYVNCRADE